MGLHAQQRLVQQGILPQRIRFAGVWRAYRRALREYKRRPDPGERLIELIDRAIIDPYERKTEAQARSRPRW